MQVRDSGGGNEAIVSVTALDQWIPVALTFTADEVRRGAFAPSEGTGAADFDFTDVQIREVDELAATLSVRPRVLLTSG